MNTTITSPQPVTTQPVHLSEETRKECRLLTKRANEGLTFDEATELLQLQRNAALKAEADQLAELHSEGRTFPVQHVNIHE